MKKNKEIQANQTDEAHQDVLHVLDNLPTIYLTKEEINKVVKHIAGNKDKIYFDYINDYIRDVYSTDTDSVITRSAIKKRRKARENEGNWYK